MRRLAFAPALFLAALATAQGYLDVTPASGIQNVPLSVSTFGTGLCCGDFDGDGDLDLVVPGVPGGPIQYFRNDGRLTFTELTATANLGTALDPRSCHAADIDNDGDPDILLGNLRQPLQLFVNDGTGHFTEEAQARGLTATPSAHGVTFGDFDRDGWLDVYVANRELAPNLLYRNLGGGVFQDVTAAAGAGAAGLTFLAVFVDYDEDLWPDIYCVNDRGPSLGPNMMLRNNGDGTFTDVSAAINAGHAIDGMGVDFVDVFDDGGVDLYCSDVPVDHLFLQWNAAAGQYSVDQYTYRISGGGVGWAVHFFDHDNDGWQDLHLVDQYAGNVLWRNPGQPASAAAPWTDLAPGLGLMQVWVQFTAMTGDLDDDGGIDLVQRYAASPFQQAPVALTLHHNQGPFGNWLKVRTRGVVSNRDGFGARVEVLAGGLHQRQWVRSGTGFLSGDDRRVHFGLGAAAAVDQLRVTWPSGQVQRLDNVAANQVLEVTEPSFALAGAPVVGGTARLDLSVPGEQGLPYAMVVAFTDTPRTQLPDGRLLPLTLDALAGYTIVPGNGLIPNSLGFLSAAGTASTPLQIPNVPAISGLRLFATAATFEATGFPFVRTIFPRAVEIAIR